MDAVSTPEDDDELIKNMFAADPELPTDLIKHRSQDLHRLLRRLDVVTKNSSSGGLQDLSDCAIKGFLEKLVDIYTYTINSLKLARAVEKLWQPFVLKYSHFITEVMERHIIDIVSCDWSNFDAVVKVSTMLEHNKMTQQIIKKHLVCVASWVTRQLSPLLELSPCNLTVIQCQCLYCLVKICLQLFQVCPSDLGSVLWRPRSMDQSDVILCKTDSDSALYQSVKVIMKSLVHILSAQGYQTDCIILCGTAVTLMLNTATEAPLASHTFYSILSVILDSGLKFNYETIGQQISVVESSPDKSNIEKLEHLSADRLGAVTLIRGVVACGSVEILFSSSPYLKIQKSKCDNLMDMKDQNAKLADHSEPYQLTFHVLFEFIHILCQGDITLHYQSFQILLLWYARLTKFPSAEESIFLATNVSSILKSSLQLVMLNWDSPVEDVPETVVEIFTHMMSVWRKWRENLEQWPEQILATLLKTPWYVKGKYRILATLLKYIDSYKVLQDNPEILSQLLQCLTTNHLASSATNVYKAFLQEMQTKDKIKSIEAWKTLWLDSVVHGLVDKNSLLRYNTSLYWVPVTFKFLPSSAEVLQGHLSALIDNGESGICKSRLLHAWVIVAKTIRALIGTADLTNVHIREALYSSDEDLRSQALALVCSTLKKAECISSIEVSLLKETIPHNMKIDSAPFRQHLASCIRKLLVRLRDSCIPLLRHPDKNKIKLGCALDFVDWLHRLCIDSLLPGACYQRRRGSLDLLHVIYDCLIYCPGTKQKKGFTPESCEKLIDFATSTKRWLFFSKENTESLLLCVLDGADEIQSSSCQLLTKYYTWSLEDNLSAPDNMCCHLLAESLRLCNSPKGHEGQSGSVMCELVFQKYALEKNVKFDFSLDEDSQCYTVTASHGNGDCACDFLTKLLCEIRRCITEADKNVVLASKQYPIHGMIAAITRCLTEIKELWVKPDKQILHIVGEVINTCRELIDKMLSIMASVSGQEASPSFAEIGQALENLLQENQPDYTETTSLSPEYQYMLSWCWNNIKESCLSLGELTWTVLMAKCPLQHTTIEEVSDTFLNVLTKCRHKGVIEGSRSAFVRFCSALFSSVEDKLHKFPANILSQVLRSLNTKVMSTSVTRRSAGLPIIILAVLVSEKRLKKTSLLNEAISSLFETCLTPLNDDLGVTDLPQVHGLNILNSVFSDASLSASLVGHLGPAIIMVIQQFGSPSWAVRNASTKFFSTLVTRIFGQKKTDDVLCNSITFQEFSSYYPELPPFLLDVLSEASKRDVHDISQIHPGLFPSLTLLSCLKPLDIQDGNLNGTIELFANKVKEFTRSPVYQLRHLVAPALVAMVNMADMTSAAENCLQTHIINSGKPDYNNLHGNLLFVYSLLDYIESVNSLSNLWQFVNERSWLMSTKMCLVSGQYVKILHRLLQKNTSLVVDSALQHSLISGCCDGSLQYIGEGVYTEEAVSFLFTLHSKSRTGLVELVRKLLSSSSQDARKACLENLHSCMDSLHFCQTELMSIICSRLQSETFISNICMMFELINRLYLKLEIIHPVDTDHIQDWFHHNSKLLQQYTSLGAAALTVQAIVVKQMEVDHQDSLYLGVNSPAVQELCHMICFNSSVTNETQRLSAVRALRVAGDKVLSLTLLHREPRLEKSAIRLISSCMTLIQDEDIEIRSEACKLVSSLRWSKKSLQYSRIHSNVCYELFLEYVGINFWWSQECVQYLTKQLYCPGDLKHQIHDRTSTRFQQLFDQEDNSFFAEKIYNAFCLHKCLKDVVMRCQGDGTESLSCLVQYVSELHGDLQILIQTLGKVTKGSVINICSDNVILSSICSLILVSDLVTMVTEEIDCHYLRTNITAIFKTKILPHAAIKSLQNVIKTSATSS